MERLNLRDDLRQQSGVLGPAELGRVFLGDQRVVGERLSEGAADQGLAAEVGHRDRAAVGLGQDLGRQAAPDRAAEGGGRPHGLDREFPLALVGLAHGGRLLGAGVRLSVRGRRAHVTLAGVSRTRRSARPRPRQNPDRNLAVGAVVATLEKLASGGQGLSSACLRAGSSGHPWQTLRRRARPPRIEAGRFSRVLRAPEWGLVAGIAAVLGVIYLLDRSGAFFSPYSRQTLLHQVALFGVLSVGAAVVIIAGGIDLSVGVGGGAVVGRQRQAADRLAPRGHVGGQPAVDPADRRWRSG